MNFQCCLSGTLPDGVALYSGDGLGPVGLWEMSGGCVWCTLSSGCLAVKGCRPGRSHHGRDRWSCWDQWGCELSLLGGRPGRCQPPSAAQRQHLSGAPQLAGPCTCSGLGCRARGVTEGELPCVKCMCCHALLCSLFPFLLGKFKNSFL